MVYRKSGDVDVRKHARKVSGGYTTVRHHNRSYPPSTFTPKSYGNTYGAKPNRRNITNFDLAEEDERTYNPYADSDGDGVKNKKDCHPLDPNRQDAELKINIDAPPGTARPDAIAAAVGMEGFDITNKFFGNWTFVKKYKSEEEAEKEGKKFFEKLKPFYPGNIRYADYDVEDEEKEWLDAARERVKTEGADFFITEFRDVELDDKAFKDSKSPSDYANKLDFIFGEEHLGKGEADKIKESHEREFKESNLTWEEYKKKHMKERYPSEFEFAEKRLKKTKPNEDTDGDGVKNKDDCHPLDKNRQDDPYTVSEFEAESHADDDLHCDGCGKEIRYSRGYSDYCDNCRKYIEQGYTKDSKNNWVKKKKKYANPEDDDDRYDYYN